MIYCGLCVLDSAAQKVRPITGGQPTNCLLQGRALCAAHLLGNALCRH